MSTEIEKKNKNRNVQKHLRIQWMTGRNFREKQSTEDEILPLCNTRWKMCQPCELSHVQIRLLANGVLPWQLFVQRWCWADAGGHRASAPQENCSYVISGAPPTSNKWQRSDCSSCSAKTERENKWRPRTIKTNLMIYTFLKKDGRNHVFLKTE